MPAPNLNLDVRGAGEGINIIDISGEITGFAEDEISAAHDKASAGPIKAVLLNFERLDYMNSGGIGLLVTTLIRAQRNGHMLLAYGLSSHYRQIFELTRLDEAIGIFDDEKEALESVS
jgi:anti-anti-sigma factor